MGTSVSKGPKKESLVPQFLYDYHTTNIPKPLSESRILVLAGGASFGSYQFGAMKALVEAGYDWDVIYGVSVGSLNGAFLASYPLGESNEAIKHLEQVWLNFKSKDIAVPWNKCPGLFCGAVTALTQNKPSLYNSAPLKKQIDAYISQTMVRKSGRKFFIGCTNMNTGEFITANENSNHFNDFILASSAQPGFLPPVNIENNWYTDGGIRNIAPLDEALKYARENNIKNIDVIVNLIDQVPYFGVEKMSLLDNVNRMLTVVVNELLRTDLDAPRDDINVRVFRPSQHMFGDVLEVSKEITQQRMDLGYNDAKNVLNNS